MKSDYEEKKEARIERMKELAEKNEAASTEFYKASNRIADMIPFGQPILVGHHSEKRHRRDAERIHGYMGKSVEASNKAEYYKERAEAAENNDSISSDDPQAIEKLKAKLDKLTKKQEFYKATNKIVRSAKLSDNAKIEKLVAMGVKEETAAEFIKPGTYGILGFPQYRLTNNNATIKTVKQRIERLQKIEAMPDEEKTYGDVTVKALASENRVQMFFPGKPSEEIRTELKRSGYRWSPMNGCWQAFYSNRSKHNAIEIIKKYQAQ